MRCDRYSGIDEFFQPRRIKIRHADERDFPDATQPLEFERCLDVARYGEVPPVKCAQTQPLLSQSLQGSIDDGFNVDAINRVQIGEIWNELCMNLHLLRVRWVRSAETADQTLDSGVDIRTVEGGDPSIEEGRHVLARFLVIAREVPAAFDDPRN